MRVAVLYDLAVAEHQWPALAGAIREQHADAILATGNATPYAEDEQTRLQTLHRMLGWLGSLGVPAYVIPGQADVPERAVLQAMVNHEMSAARVQLVHGMPGFLDGEYVVCGFGGALVESGSGDQAALTYALWRAELALHLLRRLDQLRLLVLHGGPQSHPEAVTHLIKEYVPRVAVVGGDGAESRWVGDSLMVVPGAARDGRLTIVDLVHRRAEPLAV